MFPNPFLTFPSKPPINNIPAKKSSHPTKQHKLHQQPAMPRHKSGRASVIIQNLQETNQKTEKSISTKLPDIIFSPY